LNLTDFVVFNHDIVQRFIVIMAPIMLAVFVIAILSNLMQVGIVFSWQPVVPQLSRISPMKGLQRLFSKQSLMELFKSVSKLILVGVVAYWTVKGEMDGLLSIGGTGVAAIALYISKVILKIFFFASVAMILLGALDYAFQRWQFEQQLKMTKQEVKEEFKRTEGDPLVKSRIRRIQQEVARRRMMQEVPKADVVVTNPVHLALALQYDSAVMTAPRIIAKGAGQLAERIKALAKEHKIPIVEDKELAQNLYRMVEIGAEVPSLLYHAVAEVLAYVYRIKGKTA
jgi:flagellar biosynthetic protein FlhB